VLRFRRILGPDLSDTRKGGWSMKVGTKVLVVHEISGWKEAFRVVYVAGSYWNFRRIRESDLGENYVVYRVRN
jgi:hypothetical protein